MKKKCDCGAHIAREPIHSDWCSTNEPEEESLDEIMFDITAKGDNSKSFWLNTPDGININLDFDDAEEII